MKKRYYLLIFLALGYIAWKYITYEPLYKYETLADGWVLHTNKYYEFEYPTRLRDSGKRLISFSKFTDTRNELIVLPYHGGGVASMNGLISRGIPIRLPDTIVESLRIKYPKRAETYFDSIAKTYDIFEVEENVEIDTFNHGFIYKINFEGEEFIYKTQAHTEDWEFDYALNHHIEWDTIDGYSRRHEYNKSNPAINARCGLLDIVDSCMYGYLLSIEETNTNNPQLALSEADVRRILESFRLNWRYIPPEVEPDYKIHEPDKKG